MAASTGLRWSWSDPSTTWTGPVARFRRALARNASFSTRRRRRSAPVIKAGDLSPVRDFSHVGDVVDGYLLLLDRGTPGEIYRSLLRRRPKHPEMFSTSCRRSWAPPSRFRSTLGDSDRSEIPWLVGNPGRVEALGWKRRRTVGDALQELIDSLQRHSPSVPGSASSSTR